MKNTSVMKFSVLGICTMAIGLSGVTANAETASARALNGISSKRNASVGKIEKSVQQSMDEAVLMEKFRKSVKSDEIESLLREVEAAIEGYRKFYLFSKSERIKSGQSEPSEAESRAKALLDLYQRELSQIQYFSIVAEQKLPIGQAPTVDQISALLEAALKEKDLALERHMALDSLKKRIAAQAEKKKQATVASEKSLKDFYPTADYGSVYSGEQE